ncbi:DUF4185 domain-containing protein [Actinoplanes sp. NBC_00393]|uniref:DUF4185 domain-containing protein n=1 Tax=Actinoplanes sp. NBC_00393 TaxID=2975953 RepID=UPI002E1BADDE
MRRLVAFIAACCLAFAAAAAPPRSAAQFFQLFQDRNDWTWSGGDYVASLRAANGHTYWSFGDTLLGAQDPVTGGYQPPGPGWAPNSILVQRNGVLAAAVATPAIPLPGDGDSYWAQGMFEANGSLYVMAQRWRPLGGDNFELRGVELAKFGFNADGTLTARGLVRTPSSGKIGATSPATAQYAADAVVVGPYVYLFGYANDAARYRQPTYAAFAPVASVENPSAWQFFSGGVWKPDMAAATPIVDWQVSSVRRIGGNWVLAYKPGHGGGDTVYLERRSNLFGKPEATTTIHSPAGTTPGGRQYVTYAPQLHPAQPLSSGKLLVSIAWNGRTPADNEADADLYKPRFHEVTLR